MHYTFKDEDRRLVERITLPGRGIRRERHPSGVLYPEKSADGGKPDPLMGFTIPRVRVPLHTTWNCTLTLYATYLFMFRIWEKDGEVSSAVTIHLGITTGSSRAAVRKRLIRKVRRNERLKERDGCIDFGFRLELQVLSAEIIDRMLRQHMFADQHGILELFLMAACCQRSTTEGIEVECETLNGWAPNYSMARTSFEKTLQSLYPPDEGWNASVWRIERVDPTAVL